MYGFCYPLIFAGEKVDLPDQERRQIPYLDSRPNCSKANIKCIKLHSFMVQRAGTNKKPQTLHGDGRSAEAEEARKSVETGG